MNDEIYIDFPRCLKEILKNWYWIVLSVVIITGSVFYMTHTTQVRYYAQATLYSSVYGSTKESVQQANYLTNYTDLIYTEKVCERARVLLGTTNLSAKNISGMISVSTDEDSVIMRINAYSYDPKTAVEVANAVAESFVIEARSITGDTTLQMLDEAQMAYQSGRPAWIKNCMIAFVVALLLPMAIVFIKETFSDSVYHVNDASLNDELEIIGIIPIQKEM